MSYSVEKFVLHFHDAKQAGPHMDLRIQIPNRDALSSFALPKNKLPEKPGDKVLAVRTNDHPLIWISIDNINIPDGQYGAGSIKTLQKGVCEIEGWSNKHITFRVKSTDKKYLNGRFSLIKFQGKKTSDRNNLWVLVKTKKQ